MHKVRNLHETPHTTLPCPYVKMYTIEGIGIGKNKRISNSKRKTKVMRNTVHPVFEETLDYFLPATADLNHRRLEVSVCSDRGLLGLNVVLCRCIVNLSPLYDEMVKRSSATADVTEWYVMTPPIPDPSGTPNKSRKMRRSMSFASPNGASLASSTISKSSTRSKDQYNSKVSL